MQPAGPNGHAAACFGKSADVSDNPCPFPPFRTMQRVYTFQEALSRHISELFLKFEKKRLLLERREKNLLHRAQKAQNLTHRFRLGERT